MSNGITLKNPVVNSVPPAIALGKKAVDDNGRSLSTGLKANIDVVSSFLGNGLADKGKVLSKINESMGYSSNLLRVTMDSLSSMATTLSDMLALTVQNGGSEAAVRSLQDILTQKVEQLKNQIKTADYDGRKLLNGDLGSDPSVRTKFSTKPVSVASYTPGNFAAAGVIGKTAINVANNTIATGVAGDKIVIGTVSFSFVGANPDYSKNQILKGNSDLETAQNIATAIRNSQDETLRLYNVDVLEKTVVISQRSAGGNIPLTVTTTSVGNALVATPPSTQTVTFGAAATADTETFTIAGVTFTFKANGLPAYADNEVDLGGGAAAASAANLVAKIQAHPVTAGLIARGLLTVSAAAAVVTVQSAGGNSMVNITSSDLANEVIAQVVGSTAYTARVGGIDVTGIKDADGFIGQLTSTLTLTNYNRGANTAAALYNQLTGLTQASTGAGDTTIAMTATIGGKSFQAVQFIANAANIPNGRVIEFKAQDGSKFSVVLAANRDITTDINTQNNLVNEIKTLLDSATFTQTRDLTINTDAGDITVNGASVASVKGMTVSLRSDDFTDKKFENFAIEAGTDGGGSVKLTVTISGTNYVVDNLLPANLIKGLEVDLLPQGGGNSVLRINLGDKGLTSLNDIQNYSPIATAITAALTSSGSGIDVRVGLGFDDSLKVQVPDVSISKLFRDNAGLFVQTLSVLNPADAKIAQDVVTNALATVRSALAKVQGQGETIAAASTSLESSIAVTKDAASGYLDTDLVEAASAFAAALKSILAAISTLQAGARVADAGLEIIKSAAS